MDASGKKKSILIVEDEPDILHLLDDTFQHYGFRVDLESEPDLAFDKFRDRPKEYDAILLDLLEMVALIATLTIYFTNMPLESTTNSNPY